MSIEIGTLKFTRVEKTEIGKGGITKLTFKGGIIAQVKPGATTYSVEWNGIQYDQVTGHKISADGKWLEVDGKVRSRPGKIIQTVVGEKKVISQISNFVPPCMEGRKCGYGCGFTKGNPIHFKKDCINNDSTSHKNLLVIEKSLGRPLKRDDWCSECCDLKPKSD